MDPIKQGIDIFNAPRQDDDPNLIQDIINILSRNDIDPSIIKDNTELMSYYDANPEAQRFMIQTHIRQVLFTIPNISNLTSLVMTLNEPVDYNNWLYLFESHIVPVLKDINTDDTSN